MLKKCDSFMNHIPLINYIILCLVRSLSCWFVEFIILIVFFCLNYVVLDHISQKNTKIISNKSKQMRLEETTTVTQLSHFLRNLQTAQHLWQIFMNILWHRKRFCCLVTHYFQSLHFLSARIPFPRYESTENTIKSIEFSWEVFGFIWNIKYLRRFFMLDLIHQSAAI